LIDPEIKLLLNELQRLIQSYRFKKSMSYAELAKQIGISKAMAMNYEKDPEIVIPFHKLLGILKTLEVPKDDILKAIKIYY